jgi:hypothetical protein
MTAESAVRCNYCETAVPADEVFQPYRHNDTVNRCKDAAACQRRADAVFDPSLTRGDWNRLVPQRAVSGLTCALCRTDNPPGGVIEIGTGHACHDRASCEQRQGLDLAPWTDETPDAMLEATGARFQIPVAPRMDAAPPPAPLDYDQMQALAASEAAGRKRVRG